MSQVLRQSTEIKVRIGPFMDATDAVTPETGITLGAADQAEALKADGAAVVDISGATWAAVTGADGWYDLTLTTSHTDTVGTLEIVVQDSSVSLPVFARFQVVEEAAYDAIFAASAAPATAAGVSAVETDTQDLQTQIGTVGAGLTDLGGMSTTMKAEVNAEVDTALDTAIPGVPTANSINERIAAIDDLTQASGGGDLAAILADTNELQADDVPGLIAALDTVVDRVEADTQDIQSRLPAALVNSRMDATIDGTGMESGAVSAILTTQMTEAYNTDGSAPTLAQALHLLIAVLTESSVSGTTMTAKKLDGSTAAATFTLDDATTPTSITRAS